MPAYDYLCKDCGKNFELFISINKYDGDSNKKCPECGSTETERIFMSFNVLTGSGKKPGNDRSCTPGSGCCG